MSKSECYRNNSFVFLGMFIVLMLLGFFPSEYQGLLIIGGISSLLMYVFSIRQYFKHLDLEFIEAGKEMLREERRKAQLKEQYNRDTE